MYCVKNYFEGYEHVYESQTAYQSCCGPILLFTFSLAVLATGTEKLNEDQVHLKKFHHSPFCIEKIG